MTHKKYIELLQKSGVKTAYIQQKKKFLVALQQHEDIVLPEAVCFAFLLPDTIDERKQILQSSTSAVIRDACTLRNRANGYRDTAQVNNLLNIAKPQKTHRNAVYVFLVDTLYNIKKRKIPHLTIHKHRENWLRVADAFGQWKIRYLIEDTVFKVLEPESYSLMQSLIQKRKRTHRQLFKDIQSIVSSAFVRKGIQQFSVQWRQKNVFGIYQKMMMKNKSINHINDLFGIRIIVPTKEDCYRTCVILHELWPPFAESYKDYIASPKGNGYQSIHTVVQCLELKRVEFQIRTPKMDYIAKHGPASHKEYKAHACTFAN